jgi:tetratricopeptide (TPR) repeat protein
MAETEFKYDVFISYSSANKDWVRKTFVPILEKAGLKVCDYYRDFDPGAPIVKEMERAILESRRTILVLSPAYLGSGWTEFENLMLQTLDAANQERRLLPVIYERCDLPLRFRYMNCINFDNPDDIEIEWQRLSRALSVTVSPALLDPKAADIRSRETWHLAHPYPMPPNFTGRATELKMLDNWLADDRDRLFILRALGGFGKSALAWQWINTCVDPTEWTKLVWWSFYEGDASFEHFIEETLKYLKLEVPQGQRPQVDELLKAMQRQKILLIMDGFERVLRAYSSMNAAYQGDEPEVEDNQLDCVNINAEIFLKSVCSLPDIKSKVLMTTRLTPRAVKPRGEFMLGCREVELTAMQKEDAVAFFRKQGIKGTHAEIEAACASHGYHPLSLRLLAGRILKDFENPADIVVAQKLKIEGDIIQQKHHVLEVSHNILPLHEQKLLSTIACFRSPVELKTLEAIAENKISLNEDLRDLVERGLLHFDEKNKKFDLHPIVRRYAYERLTAPDRTIAHNRLRDYFAGVDVPMTSLNLDDLLPVIELYHHSIQAGRYEESFELWLNRLTKPLYSLGSYQISIELLRLFFPNGENRLPSLEKEWAQVGVMSQLASMYRLSGQPRRALLMVKAAKEIHYESLSAWHKAWRLFNVSFQQSILGELAEAEENVRQSLDLLINAKNEYIPSSFRNSLGILLAYRGAFAESAIELNEALRLSEKGGDAQDTGITWADSAFRALLMNDTQLALKAAQQAITFAEIHPVEHDFIRAKWLLGAAYYLNNETDVAEYHFLDALTHCRASDDVEHESDILLALARLRHNQKKYEEAKSLAEEALLITERCGYVLQGADVNLFLAQYALEQEKDKVKAKECAETALKLAYCDGPPYYYKVAYHEAERFLENLK